MEWNLVLELSASLLAGRIIEGHLVEPLKNPLVQGQPRCLSRPLKDLIKRAPPHWLGQYLNEFYHDTHGYS